MRMLAHTTTLLLLFAGSAGATNRYFSDLNSKSPNGRFLAEAKSPANHNPDRRVPFQKDFTITLTDTRQRETIWSWKQGKEDASPVELILTDDGHLIMLDAYNYYHVFDAEGARMKVFGILDSLPKAEKDTFTDWTTAGVMWRQYSQQGFVACDGKSYFYIRLYWGRTFIIDIHAARLETSPELARHVEQQILRQTKDLIEQFNGEYYTKCDSCGEQHLRPELANAVFVIKKHRIPEGEKLLNEVIKRTDDNRNSDLKRYLDRIQGKSNAAQPDARGAR